MTNAEHTLNVQRLSFSSLRCGWTIKPVMSAWGCLLTPASRAVERPFPAPHLISRRDLRVDLTRCRSHCSHLNALQCHCLYCVGRSHRAIIKTMTIVVSQQFYFFLSLTSLFSSVRHSPTLYVALVGPTSRKPFSFVANSALTASRV